MDFFSDSNDFLFDEEPLGNNEMKDKSGDEKISQPKNDMTKGFFQPQLFTKAPLHYNYGVMEPMTNFHQGIQQTPTKQKKPKKKVEEKHSQQINLQMEGSMMQEKYRKEFESNMMMSQPQRYGYHQDDYMNNAYFYNYYNNNFSRLQEPQREITQGFLFPQHQQQNVYMSPQPMMNMNRFQMRPPGYEQPQPQPQPQMYGHTQMPQMVQGITVQQPQMQNYNIKKKTPSQRGGALSISSYKRSDNVCVKDCVPYIRKLKKLKIELKLPDDFLLVNSPGQPPRELSNPKFLLSYQLYYKSNNEPNWNLVNDSKIVPINFLFEKKIRKDAFIVIPDENYDAKKKTLIVPFELKCNQTQIVKVKSYKNTFKLQLIVYTTTGSMNMNASFVYKYDTRHKNDKIYKKRYKKLTFIVGHENTIFTHLDDNYVIPIHNDQTLFESHFFHQK